LHNKISFSKLKIIVRSIAKLKIILESIQPNLKLEKSFIFTLKINDIVLTTSKGELK